MAAKNQVVYRYQWIRDDQINCDDKITIITNALSTFFWTFSALVSMLVDDWGDLKNSFWTEPVYLKLIFI